MVVDTAWFSVDKEGLAKLLARKGKEFVVYELLQNAWDTDAKRVDVSLVPINGRPMAALIVEDDDPEGFQDLTHAFTLFAESHKKGDPEKRGRFNIGEKLVLALCDIARIETTTGTVYFDKDGRHRSLHKREHGSSFTAEIRMTRDELKAVEVAVQKLIPPTIVDTIFNGSPLAKRTCVARFKAHLNSEIADEEGYLKRILRETLIEVYEPFEGEAASIYEMGIPVVETGDKWHYNVCIAPETKILRADLTYGRALDLNIGDALVGFDENRSGARRSFRKSLVTHIEKILRPSYRLTFDDGTAVVCSKDHQWLTGRGKSRKWMTTAAMVPQIKAKPGSRIAKLFDVWASDTSYAGGYLAASVDGEGSLFQRNVYNPKGKRTELMFSQCDNEMHDQVRLFLNQAGIAYRSSRVTHVSKKQRPNNRLNISSRKDIVKFLGKYRPARLLPKFNVDMLGAINTKDTVRLVKKEFLGIQTVMAIETTTHTFVAEGLASHNCQKVPLNSDRDNVTSGWLQFLRMHVLNQMHYKISKEEATQKWVRDASADADVTPVALETVMTHRFGKKRVIYDPTDLEGNKRAASEGYTVVTGGSLSREEWYNVKRDNTMLPAGKVTPSSQLLATSLDGVDDTVPEEKWTAAMAQIADYARGLGGRLLDGAVSVQIVNRFREHHTAWYGNCVLTFNLARLGHAWFNDGIRQEVDRLIIHEFGHHFSADHLSKEYHDALCKLGAKLTELALETPDFFKRHGREGA